jgi:hypothetical protein
LHQPCAKAATAKNLIHHKGGQEIRVIARDASMAEGDNGLRAIKGDDFQARLGQKFGMLGAALGPLRACLRTGDPATGPNLRR